MATIGIKMRVFVPKEVLNTARVFDNIQHTMIQKTIPDLKKEFQPTYRTWSQKNYPNFQGQSYFGVRVMWVKVFTYATTYRLVNAGAKPHIIQVRRSKLLRFQKGYARKTRPRILYSSVGGKFGDYISTPIVHHPGHEAREFDKEIAEQYQSTFEKDVQDAIKDALP